jgi:TonB-linked SusC/RagA family outer membrane protein
MKLNFDLLKQSLLLVCLMVLSSAAWSQRTVTGTITDAENGEPLIGATVLVTGTSVGTVTDFDGNYSVEVPEGSNSLEFSYAGYASQTITLGSSDVIDVQMAAGALLDEVVVIGYGTVKKSDLTGAVTAVGEEDFNKGVFVSPDALIQGKAAGVQVLNNSGQPGGAATIRIRGNSSIRAGNQPLFVVDGIQLTGNSTKPGTNTGDLGSTAASNPLNYLNPADIESMQVLKDASATAIYGSRGANGVVIITTKRGKAGVPQINFSTSVGFSNILRKYDVLTADEYRDALTEYGLTSGDYGSSVDAFDEITRTGLVQNHGFSISGGNDKGTYRIGLYYLDQEGIIQGNDLQRFSANISGNYKFLKDDRFQVGFNLITAQAIENGPAVSTNAGFRGSLIGNALQWNPTESMYNADGTPKIDPDFGDFVNPVALLEAYQDRTNTLDLLGSISPSYRLTDWLTYKFQYSAAFGIGNRRAQLANWINVQDIRDRGLAAFNEEQNSNQILTHSLNINTDLAYGITLNAVAGYEYQIFKSRGFGFWGQDFPVDNFDYTNIFQYIPRESRQVSSFQDPSAELQSYFARADINIRDRFLLTGTVRADGSSKFGANNKYGVFPAFAAAWNLHNEGFMTGGLFDQLKVRASWGLTGNSEFPAGAAQDRYGFNLGSITLENLANPDLRWETTTSYGVGIDFAVFNYKLTGTIDYFNRNTTDLLFQFPTIQPAPAGLYWINLDGNVVNSGVEVTLNWNVVNNSKVNWNIGGNVTLVDNVVENYDGPPVIYGALFGQGISGATIMRLENGQPLNAFYTRDFVEIGEDGQAVYANNGELAYLGNPNPDAILGLYTDVSFGNFALSMNFNGTLGNDIYNNTKNTVLPIGNLGSRNIDASLLDGDVQEATSNAVASSDRYIEDGSYVKLANATLSYNLGNIGKGIRNARLYITGQNLAVFTNYTGFDPEVNTVNEFNGLPSTGIEYIPYPSARTIILGANFAF